MGIRSTSYEDLLGLRLWLAATSTLACLCCFILDLTPRIALAWRLNAASQLPASSASPTSPHHSQGMFIPAVQRKRRLHHPLFCTHLPRDLYVHLGTARYWDRMLERWNWARGEPNPLKRINSGVLYLPPYSKFSPPSNISQVFHRYLCVLLHCVTPLIPPRSFGCYMYQPSLAQPIQTAQPGTAASPASPASIYPISYVEP
ncbi:MAG: hypothetical protein JWR35_3893 [Marmoricola sp.]|nr:hypothetical protein [Marmoricola sp.]